MGEPAQVHLTLGTAGHIDHGKTALVEALTGKNTDRLPEERRRGLSIELGFAELGLDRGPRLSVVDVPGHERFVRTMVAGATGVDLFLMVVAADDGVMPQTREHWTVLRALGLERGVVALTKCDSADPERRRRAAAGARRLVLNAPLVEVSARNGQGLDALRDAIAWVAVEVAASGRALSQWPYTEAVLHVDRVFTLKGIGTVVTGTLWSGSLARGDRVEILPAGKTARIRSIQVHGRTREIAAAGRRVALNLGGVERSAIRRGDVVASAGSGLAPTYRLDVELRLEPGGKSPAGRRIQVHHGTRDAPARVVALNDERTLAQLRLEVPLLARAGERFVIRSIAPSETLGGGVVFDAHPRRHGPGQATDRLRLIREAEPETLLELALTESEKALAEDPRRWTSSSLLGPALRRFPPSRWQEAVHRLQAAGKVVASGGRLRSAAAGGAGQRDGPVRRRARAAAGPSSHALRMLGLLRRDGPQPRAPQALTDKLGIERRQALSLLEELVRTGHAVRVRPGVYYATEELERVRAEVLDLIRKWGSATIAEIRDELGTSRKYAQALLEHLDATHVTLRQGDRHVLRRPPAKRSPAGAGAATLAPGRQGSGGPAGLQSQ